MESALPILSIVLNVILVILFFTQRKSGGVKLNLDPYFSSLQHTMERMERGLREEMAKGRQETNQNAKQHREELTVAFSRFNQNININISEINTQQKHLLDSFAKQLAEMTLMNEQKLNDIRGTVEQKLQYIQEQNTKKLDEMRATVDERLQTTLEKRLGESFKVVSERLEQVYKSLGEMQTLANGLSNGVGDLKKVLSNVKTRGTLGEVQLESLLEQMFTVDQYDRNVATKEHSNDRVEFAIKLPDRDGSGEMVYLPIDAKFPLEDYQRLVEAEEAGDLQARKEAAKQLENRVKLEAKSIRDKYVEVPRTTPFGIMFLATESLYTEVLRRPGLWDTLQRDYQVIVTGPTTLTAILTSLQMGFRTLAIQKQSSEVWRLLSGIKTEWGKYNDVLTKVQKKLQEASNTIDTAQVRHRAIDRKLRDVSELPSSSNENTLFSLEEYQEAVSE